MDRHVIVDRRGQRSDRNAKNLERLKNRYKAQIRRRVDGLLGDRALEDIGLSGDIIIKPQDTDEPHFAQDGTTGEWERVYPGNDQYAAGDVIEKSENGEGSGDSGSIASEEGGGEDEFSFAMSPKELLDIYFEDCELPRLDKKYLIEGIEKHFVQSGIVSNGPTARMHIRRTFRQSIMRRISQRGAVNEAIQELEAEIETYRTKQNYGPEDGASDPELQELLRKLEELKKKKPAFLDDIDTRFRNIIVEPAPDYKAAMFCIMDVSGSMGEKEKYISKKFFRILYLFLMRNYKHVELVFIRHHEVADEVSQEEFFSDKTSGGTLVSSSLLCAEDIITKRYSASEWNIYVAQASDGDNSFKDSELCGDILLSRLLSLVQYWAYIEIAEKPQNLWDDYERVSAYDTERSFAMARVTSPRQVFSVFRELFKKKGVE